MSSANAVEETFRSAPHLLNPVTIPPPRLAPTPVRDPALESVPTGAAVAAVERLQPRSGHRTVFVLGDALGALVACAVLSPPPVAFALPLLWVVLVAAMRGYESRFVLGGPEGLRRVLRAGLGLVVMSAAASWFVDLPTEPGALLSLVVITTGLALLLRVTSTRVLRRRRQQGRGHTLRVLLAGHHHQVAEVLNELDGLHNQGIEVVGACTHGKRMNRSLSVPVARGLTSASASAAELSADAVIVLPCKHLDNATLRRLTWQLEPSNTQLFVMPGLTDVAETRTTMATVGSMSMVHVRHAELRGWRRVLKETWERLAAALLLLLLSPLLLVLMIAIRLESPGPAIFRQQRVGRDDRPFTMFKLRTMCDLAEERLVELASHNEVDGVLFKVRNDPRITRLGGFLRRYSLDELPQLINVVRGDMALVGPRPPLPAEVASYADDVRRRLAVKPGVTGLWQVSGRSDLPWEEAVRLDLRYVDNWSLGLDLSIMLRTARAVISHQGAY